MGVIVVFIVTRCWCANAFRVTRNRHLTITLAGSHGKILPFNQFRMAGRHLRRGAATRPSHTLRPLLICFVGYNAFCAHPPKCESVDIMALRGMFLLCMQVRFMLFFVLMCSLWQIHVSFVWQIHVSFIRMRQFYNWYFLFIV